MLTIAYYFLQVVLCSGMLMGYYWLVLRNKRFHQYNRFYLLAVAVLSWIVPLIKIQWGYTPTVITEEPQVLRLLSVVADGNSQIDETITQKGFEWSWDIFATGIYLLVAAVLLMGLLRALFRLHHLLKVHSCKTVGDIYLILTQAKGTPFSFFRYIFWNEEIDIRSEAGKQILQHELTHVQQKHSFDKLLIQVILIGGWFNPFFWLLRKEMDMIHEFIADKKAVNNGDIASLAQMLLTAAYPQQQFALTHPFFFSPIKRRLKMLANTRNPRFSYIRRLVVLPLLAIVIVLFAFRNKEQRINATISVATVMENVAADQKKLAGSVLEKINDYFGIGKLAINDSYKGYPVFYNGKRITVPAQIQLSDFRTMNFISQIDIHNLHITDTLRVPAMAQIMNQPAPLFVVNGVTQVNMKSIDAIAPDDISSVNVWKGPGAISKYGADANNGVVEITTKAYNAASEEHVTIPLQGIAKDAFNNPAISRKVYVKNIIHQHTATGTKVWEETNEAITNENGIFKVQIGLGKQSPDNTASDLSEIEWAQGPFFLNTKVAVAPSTPLAWWKPEDNYVDIGTTQMMSVPYQLFMKEEKHPSLNDPSIPAAPSTQMLVTDSAGNVTWTTPKNSVKQTTDVTSFNLNFLISEGVSVDVPANTTAIVSVAFSGVKKGDPILVTPKVENSSWAVYSAWVASDNKVSVRFANYTDKPITIPGNQYKIVAIAGDQKDNTEKFKALGKYPDTLVWKKDKERVRDLSLPQQLQAVADKDGNINWELAKPVPLYIIDGVRSDKGFTAVDPNDIVSIDIVKDASAVREFGDAGKNGVIYITTKKKYPAVGEVKKEWLKPLTVQGHKLEKTNNGVTDISTTKKPLTVSDVKLEQGKPIISLLSQNLNTHQFIGMHVTDSTIIIGDANGRPLSNSTIYIVDGAKMLQGKIKLSEISSMNVLQEEAAVAKYGEEGKYGVIEITTKNVKIKNLKLQEVTVTGYNSKKTSANDQQKKTLNLALDTVFDHPQIEAAFPGGLPGWTKYLQRILDHTVAAKNGAPSGKYTVVVSFVVSRSGDVSNVEALNDPGYGTKQEAIRLIVKGPKWVPAIQHAKNVLSQHKESITFFVAAKDAKLKTGNIEPVVTTDAEVMRGDRQRTRDEEIAFRVLAARAAKNNNKFFFIVDGSPCLLSDASGVNYLRVDGTTDVAIIVDGKEISADELNTRYGRNYKFYAELTRNSKKYKKTVFFLATKPTTDGEIDKYLN